MARHYSLTNWWVGSLERKKKEVKSQCNSRIYTWALCRPKSPATRLFIQSLAEFNNKENIKALHSCPFVRGINWWLPYGFPSQMVNNCRKRFCDIMILMNVKKKYVVKFAVGEIKNLWETFVEICNKCLFFESDVREISLVMLLDVCHLYKPCMKILNVYLYVKTWPCNVVVQQTKDMAKLPLLTYWGLKKWPTSADDNFKCVFVNEIVIFQFELHWNLIPMIWLMIIILR